MGLRVALPMVMVLALFTATYELKNTILIYLMSGSAHLLRA
jgi:hypothetical protein